MRRTWIVLATVLYSSFVFASQSDFASGVIRFRFVHDYLIVVPAYINGQGPYDFVLDTGSNTSLIDPEIAAALALNLQPEVEVTTIAGSRKMREVSAALSWVPGSVSGSLSLMVHDLGDLHALDQRIRGILGLNFLSQYDYLVDLRARTIRLHLDSVPTGERQGFDFSGGRILLHAVMPGLASSPQRLSLDSAASQIVLFAHPLGLNAGTSSTQMAHTIAGDVPLARYRLKVLVIGSFFAHDLPASLMDLGPQRQGRIEDGLLPVALFRSVYFSNSGKFVILNAREGT